MKTKILIIIGICVLVIGGIILFFVLRKTEDTKITDLKKMKFSFTQGYMINSDTYYELENDDYGCKVTIKPYEYDEASKASFYVDESISKNVLDVLNKYNVKKWDGFKGDNKYVLDGDTFSMNITLKNGTEITASGYMEWPENYSKVKSELEDIFMKLYYETDR